MITGIDHVDGSPMVFLCHSYVWSEPCVFGVLVAKRFSQGRQDQLCTSPGRIRDAYLGHVHARFFIQSLPGEQPL